MGIFPLAGKGGTVAVPLSDGKYSDALNGEEVTVQGGKLTIADRAVVIL